MKHVEPSGTLQHAASLNSSELPPASAPLPDPRPAPVPGEEPKAPEVCVAIPVYNGEQYIMETLESLLAQDYPNLRILAINNASTDRTQALLETVEDERFELRSFEDHVPIAENWNRAFAAASSGDYLMLVSADDVLRPGAVRALARALEEHPACHVALGQAGLRNELQQEILFLWPTSRPSPGVISDLEGHILKNGFNLNINAAMFRREVEPFYDSSWAGVADVDLFIRLGRSGRQAVCLAEEVLLFRKHEASASRDAVQVWDLTLKLLARYTRTSTKKRWYRHRINRILLWLAVYLVHTGRTQSAQKYLRKYRSESAWWMQRLVQSLTRHPGLVHLLIVSRSLMMRQMTTWDDWKHFFPPDVRVLALPSWATPRLFIPAHTPLQRWQRSALYPAFKAHARAFRFLLRIRAATVKTPTKRVPSRPWPLEEFIRDVLPQATSVSVLMGTPGPNQKITIQLSDDHNQIVGYLKYADKPAAQQQIRHEFTMLSNLPAGVGPVPLKFGPWNKGEALLTTPLTGKQVPVSLRPDERVTTFLQQLITGPPVPLALHPWAQAHEKDQEIAPFLELLSERPWPVVVQHGDFAPWNLLLDRNGTIKAYDWEYGTLEGFPFLDLSYYVLQVACLIRLWDPGKAAARARDYLAGSGFGLSPREADALVGLAAYNAYRGFLAAGGRPDDAEMRWWRSVWKKEQRSRPYGLSTSARAR